MSSQKSGVDYLRVTTATEGRQGVGFVSMETSSVDESRLCINPKEEKKIVNWYKPTPTATMSKQKRGGGAGGAGGAGGVGAGAGGGGGEAVRKQRKASFPCRLWKAGAVS
ncbi:hypothetical protein PAMP_021533 [Pampus punctatissimus]